MALFRRVNAIRPSPPELPPRPLLVNRWTAYAVLGYVSVFSMFAGYVTMQYPPDYFKMPGVWGVAFMIAGAVGLVVLVIPRWPTVTMWAGASMSGLAISRGLFIAASVDFDEWWGVLAPSARSLDGITSSFVIASFQWVTCGVLLFVSWPALIHDSGVHRRTVP